MAASGPEVIGILTASSNSGFSCLNELLSSSSGHSIRAIYRSEAKAAELRKLHGGRPNLEIVTGVDAFDPSTLQSALSGCTVAFLVTPHDPARGIADDAALVRNMMIAAADAKVKHIVFAASWTVNAADRLPGLASRFAPGEELLLELEKSRGITWTVLRGGFFLDNFRQLFSTLKTSNEIRFANFCVPANDPADIGRVAATVAAKGGRGHEGRKYEISGPERLWLGDVAKVFSDVLKRDIAFIETDAAESVANFPPFLKELFLYMIEMGKEAVPVSNDVEHVTGKPAVSLSQWLAANRDYFARS